MRTSDKPIDVPTKHRLTRERRLLLVTTVLFTLVVAVVMMAWSTTSWT
ncbi:MAG: hypothetical protein WAR57_14140 [Candidatus Phosphoribacter sp.]